jgi:hypothetical protein
MAPLPQAVGMAAMAALGSARQRPEQMEAMAVRVALEVLWAMVEQAATVGMALRARTEMPV